MPPNQQETTILALEERVVKRACDGRGALMLCRNILHMGFVGEFALNFRR